MRSTAFALREHAIAKVRNVLAVGLLCLSGCGVNSLRLEYAGDVAAKGKVAAAASRTFLGEVEKSRVESNVDVLALDPACRPNMSYVLQRPKIDTVKDLERPPRGWFCSTTRSSDTFPEPVSLAPVGQDLEPTFILIDSLASYSDGLLAIIGDEEDSGVAELLEGIALARSADTLLAALSSRSPIVPAADDKRLVAATEFATFLEGLAAEQDKVQRIRKFVNEESKTQGLILALRNHLAAWELSRRSDENFRMAWSGIALERAQASDLPAAKRREFARSYYSRSSAALAGAALKPALDAALLEIADADDNLRRTLEKNPNLTPAERAKVARINRQRLTTAFEKLAAIVLSFKGA